MSSKEIPIPGPKGVPFLGNIYDIDKDVPIHSLELLADNYGTYNPITLHEAPLTRQARSTGSPTSVCPEYSSAPTN